MPVDFAPSRAQRIRHAAVAYGPALVVATATLFATAGGVDWYDGLALPSFALPGWIFGIAQALVGFAMAFAFDCILSRPDWMPDRPAAILAFLAQAGLGALWPLAFFGLRSPGAGLFVILGLLLAMSLAAQRFGRIDRRAGYGAWFCVGWTFFAALVGLSVFIRN